MHSSVPPPVADELPKLYDEQAIVYLVKLHQKSPLPENVVELNPYLYRPEQLPGEMWYCYHVCSAERKRAEFGFWRQKEAASEIFTNSDLTGWRTALEFIEIQEGQEERTCWLMQEYRLTKNGPSDANAEKESEALCRVFHNAEESEAPIVPKSDGNFYAIAEFHNFKFDGEDYLELNDLADDLSHSSSSLNTRRTSLSFDEEYFDAGALLQELESAAPDQTQQEKESSSGLTETEFVKPVEAVLQPATPGSLVSTGVKGDADQSGKNQKPDEKGGDLPGSSSSRAGVKGDADQSGKNQKPDEKGGDSPGSSSSRGKKKAADVKMKGLKKYLCMIAF